MTLFRLLLFCLCLESLIINAQIVVFKDSDYLFHFMEEKSFKDDSFGEVFWHRYQFKKKLPDGIYYYVDKYEKDSLKILKDIDNQFLIKALYFDSIRNGDYVEYALLNQSFFKKRKRVIVTESYFKDGELHGHFASKNLLGYTEYEGCYRYGKKHGFFFENNAYGVILQVKLYIDDQLICISSNHKECAFACFEEIEEDSLLNNHKIFRHGLNGFKD